MSVKSVIVIGSTIGFLALGLSFTAADFSVVRDTTLGKVVGTASLNIETYLGIPYAAAPIGELRWRSPQPHPGWADSGDILDATKLGSICPQSVYSLIPPEAIQGNEDCLFLNIFVPRNTTYGKYPVMVFMHGGGFYRRSSSGYDVSTLASTGGAIVVTFNYRLGALGFFNTEDNQVTGNYGLLDQLATLQWVQDNIENFGGDKESVTIFGQSAGAVSVLLHALSPLYHGEKQLFHRVIAESGSPFAWWSFQSSPRYHALKLMEDASCPTFSTAIGVECLRNMTSEDIVRLQGYFPSWFAEEIDSPWKPTVDGEFLTNIPDAMASSENLIADMAGKYDFLIGCNDVDSALGDSYVSTIKNQDSFIDYLKSTFKKYFDDPEKIANAVSYNYIDAADPPTTDTQWQQLTHNVTRDFMICIPALNMSQIASAQTGFDSKSFFYYFVQRPGRALINAGVASPDDNVTDGAKHGDELPYVFGLPLTLPLATQADRDLSLKMITYWTNFAKTGNPSKAGSVETEWPEYEWESQKYLQFGTKEPGQNLTRVRDHLFPEKVLFWTKELEMYEEGKGLDDSINIPKSNDSSSSETESSVVATTKGKLQGLRIVRDNYILDRFIRIPFAKPPLKSLRFMPTEPHPGWNGVLDATGNSSALEWINGCPFFALARNASWGNEDCLHLNVYVPGGINATRDIPLPVMVWFYGGAFTVGRSTGLRFYYDMERIATQGQVIGVSVNYRLGALGFLSTMDENAPGNAGLLDQVAGLRWVQDNIAAFGGDPKKVTIFGESAGGGSVSLHLVSPLSQDLFLRGIQESGSIPALWTISHNPIKYAKLLAERVGCPSDNKILLVRCLQFKPLDLITKAELFDTILVPTPFDLAWAAVVDGYFLKDAPYKLLATSADKDLLIGHNSMDGHLFATNDFFKIDLDNVPMSRDDIVFASTIFGPNVPEYISEAVAFKYIDWEEPETGLVWPKIALVNMYTDHMFVAPSYWSANERAAANGTGRTYMYRFSEKSDIKFLPEWSEANHMSELEYVFGHPFDPIIKNATEADKKLSLAMMTHWTNFAWSGDPNSPNQGDIYAEWPKYTLDTKYAFQFNTSIVTDPEQPRLMSNYRGEIVEYWTGLLKDLWSRPLGLCPAETDTTIRRGKNIEHHAKAELKAVTCIEDPLVRATDYGCVKGYEYLSQGKIIERYLGIPYAKPPTGPLRFTAPQVPDSWSDVYPAANYSKICPQGSVLNELMSEDCLYLCVYAPQFNTTVNTVEGLPVMVWIHGGRFIAGNGMEAQKVDTLASLGEVIVVTFNYRIGSFGFMTTDDEYSKGNYGLLDQQLALNWVKNNIRNFGGNPDSITMVGFSAGGHSTRLQGLSPTNTNLGITKAIFESESVLPHDDWKQLDRAIRLAEEASCPTSSGSEVMVGCLRNLDTADLLIAQAATGLYFDPTIDGEFIPVHPRELADPNEIRKRSYIIGVNNGDGSVNWDEVQEVKSEYDFHSLVNSVMEPLYGWREKLIDQHYATYDDLNFFTNETKMQYQLTQLFGDERYLTSSLDDAENYTSYGADVYFYYFTYPHQRFDVHDFPEWAGAAHGVQRSFTFGEVIDDGTESEEVVNLSLKMIEFWSNFVKTGDPNTGYPGTPATETKWPAYKGNNPARIAKNYIQFDLGNKTVVKQDLKPTEKEFWNNHLVSEQKYCEMDMPEDPTAITPESLPENPVAETMTGSVKGKRIKNDLLDVNAFFGIPYAMPPVGEFRFQNSRPIDVWGSTLDATSPVPPCMQQLSDGNIVGQENCLYLDVFMPTGLINTNTSSMPIIFWIHGDSNPDTTNLGGSFWTGGGSPVWNPSSPTIDPSYLSSFGKVVVVRPNFRLGALGFLTTQNNVAKGNYGLSDLKQALTWTWENAKSFAGDSSKITVLGQGSGAAAAELLGILPSTKNLVKRVISISGSALSPWSFCVGTECSKVADIVTETNNCQDSDILQCLRGVPAKDILTAIPFSPVTSQPDDSSNAWGTWRFTTDGDIIPDATLEDLFAGSNVDFVSGTMSHEFYDYLELSYPESTSLLWTIKRTEEFLSHSGIENWSNEAYGVAEHEYTVWDDDVDDPGLQGAVKYYTDLMFAKDFSRSIESKAMSKSGSLYQVVIKKPLTHRGENQLPSWVGGRHGDDIIYTFGIPFTSSAEYSDSDRDFSTAVMSYWISFAWHGDPNNAFFTQTWSEYSTENRAYLEMDGLERRLPRNPADFNQEKNDFWNNVVPLLQPEPDITNELFSTPKSAVSTTTTEESCISEIPPIGEGLGLALTPEEADAAIYAMFSVSLILAVVLVAILAIWICQSRAIDYRNAKTRKENSMYDNEILKDDEGTNKTVSSL